MMDGIHYNYLERASGAISRRDYLSAIEYAMRAARAPRGQELLRCDAYMLLALSSLEMGLAEDALSYAVGAHLCAVQAGDEEREARAASLVAVVVAYYPNLGEEAAVQRPAVH